MERVPENVTPSDVVTLGGDIDSGARLSPRTILAVTGACRVKDRVNPGHRRSDRWLTAMCWVLRWNRAASSR
ncbi:hypothetical protein MAUB_54630 [Mycolicibacterium aubagnense]|uniref:Uncharacterized protein n=1 Tax=Mycolicibacterium aubagnense TaxID=319707 RepID=A0ABN5Z0H4_9MYCO|nr:hypothetical protein MAUB_54630 [Mycolicibacterium aubagnense]